MNYKNLSGGSQTDLALQVERTKLGIHISVGWKH